MRQDPLYDDPALYDRIVQPGPCESFYDELARRQGEPVLELACGTGRITLALALRGHAMVGLDRSTAMLGLARRKAESSNLAISFLAHDMRVFALGRRFPLIIITCNSLAHLSSREDLVACLSCAATHLEERGVIAFDVVNPDVRRLGLIGLRTAGDDPASAGCGPVAVEEWASYDPISQVGELRLRVLEPGRPERELAPLSLRQFFPQEVPLLLDAAGLELVARYGDFGLGPLVPQSQNQICLARLRPSSPR